ncbi:restriction endonuclease subunit S [Coleofasciculus sp.]|uniref:restriction endonuclease subunit S n=1 Tax=Coleofasciculus sp. TaxID=3100458 RepID=UPI0039F8DF39
MSKKVKKRVPELRFPEFEGDWTESTLGKVSIFYDKSRIPLSFEERQQKQGIYPYYGASGIIDYINEYIFDGVYILLAEDGANILNRSTPIAFLAEGKFWVNNHAHVLKSRESDSFLAEYLENLRYESYNTGTAQPKLNADVCKKIIVRIPKIEEQEKIASFLGAIATRLDQLRRKHELLQTYKRGVMQKLFCKKIRFKQDDGSPFPDWEKKKLGQLATRQTRKNDDQSITRVLTNSASQGIVDQKEYFNKDIANSENLAGYYILELGDYVYNPRISVSAPVGPVKKNNLGQGVMSPLYTVFRFKSRDNIFYEYFFQTSLWHKYMCSVANYGARYDRMNISTSNFMALPLPFPTPAEQLKVVSFLNKIDKKIAALNQKINLIQRFPR